MEELRLRSSLKGKALTVLSPLLLIGLGGYGVARGGLDAPGLWVLLAGLVVFGAAGWVSPWSTVLDAEGVHARALLRRRPTIAWDDVVAFERAGHGRRAPLAVRTVGGRSVLLSDVPETPPVWDQIREMASRYAPGTAVDSPPPLHPFNRQSGV